MHLRDQRQTKGVLWYVIKWNICHCIKYVYNMQDIIIRKFRIFFYYNLIPDYLTHSNQHHFIDIVTNMQLSVQSMNQKENMGKKRHHKEIMIDHQHNNTQVTTTYGVRYTVLFDIRNKIILILFAIWWNFQPPIFATRAVGLSDLLTTVILNHLCKIQPILFDNYLLRWVMICFSG